MNNETKHTAGNWTIDRPDYETINIVAEKEFICEIPNYINEGEESEKKGKEAEANARLIAAAPELLKALIEVAEYHNRNAKKGEPVLSPHWESVVKSAIRKATRVS